MKETQGPIDRDIEAVTALAFFKLLILGVFLRIGGHLSALGTNWDAGIYLLTARLGYDNGDLPSHALAPLFPWLTHILALDYFGALVIANLFAVAWSAHSVKRSGSSTAGLQINPPSQLAVSLGSGFSKSLLPSPIIILWIIALRRGQWDLAVVSLPFALLTFTTIGMPAISTPRIILPAVWGLPIAYEKDLDRNLGALVLALAFSIVGLLWLLEFATGLQFIA